MNAGSLDDYAGIVTEDVVWLPPRGEAIDGREAFVAWLQPFFAQYDYTFELNPEGVRAFDRWCAETGRFRSVLTAKEGGGPQEHEGRYFVLWRLEQDDVWRIERYVDGLGG